MDIIGLDLHKRESQLSIRAEDGTITERRIVTSRERFTAVLGGRPRAASPRTICTSDPRTARAAAQPRRRPAVPRSPARPCPGAPHLRATLSGQRFGVCTQLAHSWARKRNGAPWRPVV